MKIKPGLNKIIDVVLIFALLATAYAMRIQPIGTCLMDENSYLYAIGAREVVKSQDYTQFLVKQEVPEDELAAMGEDIAEGEEADTDADAAAEEEEPEGVELEDGTILTAPQAEEVKPIERESDKYQKSGIAVFAALATRFLDIPLWNMIYYLCAFVSPLALIPMYLFVRRRTNRWGGAMAALLTATVSAYAAHSMPGHFEPDAFVFVFSVIGMCAMGESAFCDKLIKKILYALLGVCCFMVLALFCDNYYIYYVLGILPVAGPFVYNLIGKLKVKEGVVKHAIGGVMSVVFMVAGAFLLNKYINPLTFGDVITQVFGGRGEQVWPSTARFLGSLQGTPLIGGGFIGLFKPNLPGGLNHLGGIIILIAGLFSLIALVLAFIKKKNPAMRATSLFVVIWLILSIVVTILGAGSSQVITPPLIVIIGLGIGMFAERTPREKIIRPKKKKKKKGASDEEGEGEEGEGEGGEPKPSKLAAIGAALTAKIKPLAKLQEFREKRKEKKRLKEEMKTKRRKVKVARWVGTLAMIIFLMITPAYGVFALAHEKNYVPVEYREMAAWIDKNLEWDAAIVTWEGYSHYIEYTTGRKTIPDKNSLTDEFFYMLGRTFMTTDFDDAAELCCEMTGKRDGTYVLVTPDMVQNSPVIAYYGLWDIFNKVDDESLRLFGTCGPTTLSKGTRYYAAVNGIPGCKISMVYDGTGIHAELETTDPTIEPDYEISRYILVQDGHVMFNKDREDMKEEKRAAKEAAKLAKERAKQAALEKQQAELGEAAKSSSSPSTSGRSNIVPQNEVEQTLADYMPAGAESKRTEVHAPTVSELSPEMREMFSAQDLTGTSGKKNTTGTGSDGSNYNTGSSKNTTTPAKTDANVIEATPEAIENAENTAETSPEAIDEDFIPVYRGTYEKQGIDFGENPETDGLTLYVLRTGDRTSLVLCDPQIARSILVQLILTGSDMQNRFLNVYTGGLSLWKVN